MNRHLLVVMAHAGAQETFTRHYPEWRKHPDTDILVFVPAADRITLTPDDKPLPHVVGFGKAQHHGAEAIRRFRWLLQLMADQTQYHAFTLHEYDSFSLDSNVGPFIGNALTGLVYRDDRPDSGFKGTTFIHPPLCMSRGCLQKIVWAMAAVPDEAEHGFWDRWIGLVCERGYIPLHNLLKSGLGFSRNTIEDTDIPAAGEAVRNGARLLHGVKSKECYDAVTSSYAGRTK